MTNIQKINEINSLYKPPTDTQLKVIQRIITKYKFENAPSISFIKEHWYE